MACPAIQFDLNARRCYHHYHYPVQWTRFKLRRELVTDAPDTSLAANVLTFQSSSNPPTHKLHHASPPPSLNPRHFVLLGVGLLGTVAFARRRA